ncbi:MAG: 2'-5' RNA ligase family protein [Paracoccus sp. (in: a-proteobacteria)]|nr:2'-5' RNA ligase family protein [Paracoccus sp. (in: a-proteobacteria)]
MTDTLFPMPPVSHHHKLFFAAIPGPSVADALAHAWRDHGNGARFRADKLHMTLHYAAALTEDGPATVAALCDAGAALVAAPFTLTLDRLSCFAGRPDNRALVAQADDPEGRAQRIMEQLRLACVAAGLRPPKGASRTIRPHVTLAYGRDFGPERPLPDPIPWTIDDIVLINSHQGQGRHVELGRWPLRG